jgi:hypothetical protein
MEHVSLGIRLQALRSAMFKQLCPFHCVSTHLYAVLPTYSSISTMKLSLLLTTIAAASPVRIVVEQKCTKNDGMLNDSFVSRVNALPLLLRGFVPLFLLEGLY